MLIIFSIGVLYAIIKSSQVQKEQSKFGNGMIQLVTGDSAAYLVKEIFSPSGIRTSAVDVFFINNENEKVWIRAEVNYDYDPSKSAIKKGVEPGDSIHIRGNSDTIRIKKPNGSELYYKFWPLE